MMPNTPLSEISAVRLLSRSNAELNSRSIQIRDALRTSFRKGLARPIEWRRHQLFQLARMMQENAQAFAEALTEDLGKPKLESYSFEIVG
jgi:acyl-CoA reductase-like NAD-dependent aldehyde dehydrogenase